MLLLSPKIPNFWADGKIAVRLLMAKQPSPVKFQLLPLQVSQHKIKQFLLKTLFRLGN